LNEFWEIIAKYEMDLIDKTIESVSDEVTRNIAKNLKDVLSNQQISEKTGLPIETVEKL
jgi:hypothetical protein